MKNFKNKNLGEIMKVCPRCGSKNIDWLDPQSGSVWECKDCNYTGTIIERNKAIPRNLIKLNIKNLKK